MFNLYWTRRNFNENNELEKDLYKNWMHANLKYRKVCKKQKSTICTYSMSVLCRLKVALCNETERMKERKKDAYRIFIVIVWWSKCTILLWKMQKENSGQCSKL